MISPSDFLEKVEFRDAALLSFVTSAIIVPAYDAVKRDLGITRSEYLLLMALSHCSVLTAQDVSRLSGRPRNSISRAVHRMLAVGHLARDPDPTDARQARLSITETGRALHRQIAERIRVYQEEVLSPLTELERETVVNLLTKVVAQRPSAGAAEL